jgi:hypothetical protein
MRHVRLASTRERLRAALEGSTADAIHSCQVNQIRCRDGEKRPVHQPAHREPPRAGEHIASQSGACRLPLFLTGPGLLGIRRETRAARRGVESYKRRGRSMSLISEADAAEETLELIKAVKGDN